MFHAYDKTFKPIARETFRSELDKSFKNMIATIIKLIKPNQENFKVLKWLSMCHDMWSSVCMDGTIRAMKTHRIATILAKNNENI